MQTSKNLENILHSINRKGYKAYKDIRGSYKFEDYILSIDYVQGDPFASPSRLRVIMDFENTGFSTSMIDTNYKNVAFCDYITRCFHKNIKKYYKRTDGSGKSGLLMIDNPGQEIIERTSVYANETRIEVRFEVGLPAAGRKILSKETHEILFNYLPIILYNSIIYKNINKVELKQYLELAEDQYFLREAISKDNLVAFIADGSVLPRQSGISDKPLEKGAIPFSSPQSMRVSYNLPNRGEISGMAIKKGITIIAGGGYHGKSTLLNALQRSIYNHIPRDGREYVVTDQKAVKIRSEDGRRIEKVNISPFINNLPNHQSTISFSSDNASGSTSQAANILEAIEIGSKLLLIDEDTSATNFMIRDLKMQKLISKEKEPITPYIDKIQSLKNDYDVSTILVIGGCGDYFDVADSVIVMDDYIPKNLTKEAKKIANEYKFKREYKQENKFGRLTSRVVLKNSFPVGYKGMKIKAKGMYSILYNKSLIDLSAVEQIVSQSQTNCLANMLEYSISKIIDGEKTIKEITDILYSKIKEKGLDTISSFSGHPGNFVLPTRHQFAAMLNRYRNLSIRHKSS